MILQPADYRYLILARFLGQKEIFTCLCKDGFKSLCIVRNPIAFSTIVPHTDKFGDIIILILWVRSTDNTSRVIQETWRLDGFRYMSLNKVSVWVRAMIYVPLSPGDNSLVPSSENRWTIDNANRDRNIDQLGVVDYKGTSQRSVAGFWSSNENGCILHNSIDDGLGSSSLFIGCEL